MKQQMAVRDPLDPTRKFSEGGAPEHRAALGIECPTCAALVGQWCPMPGTTWNLCGARIWAACAASSDPDLRALAANHPPVDCWSER